MKFLNGSFARSCGVFTTLETKQVSKMKIIQEKNVKIMSTVQIQHLKNGVTI